MRDVLQAPQARHGGKERLRIGVLRRVEDVDGLPFLDNFAVAHDGHAVGNLGDHAHVVRNEEHRHADFLLELGNERKNLGLNRDVERRGRFVGNEELGLAGKRNGNHHALTHAARELMGKAHGNAFGVRNADELKKTNGFLQRLGFAHPAVERQAFRNLSAHGEDRVEGRHRFLEDHRDFGASQRLEFRTRGLHEVHQAPVAAAQMNGAVDDLAAPVLNEAHDGERGHGFA